MKTAQKHSVLVVDDDSKLASVLCREIDRLGYATSTAGSGGVALELMAKSEFDVVLLDLRLGDRSGLDVLREMKERSLSGEVIILTGHGTVENAIDAMKNGAFDFVTKPCKLSEVEALLEKAVQSGRLREENRAYRQYLSAGNARDPQTVNPGMLELLASLDRVAQSDVPVLICGESGTGKEIVAREIHKRSPGQDRPFVIVNCAVLQSTILESELFGHEKGAFTGAVKRKLGLFELADHGDIFLDEIGEIDEGIQAKLLRVLQFGEFRRLGGTENRSADVRVIAATNRDLNRACEERTFRQDLYFRLNVVELDLPPLRERTEDIPLLTKHFLALYGNQPFSVTDGAVRLLQRYSWPGNVRELENVVRRLLIFQDRDVVDEDAILATLPGVQSTDASPLRMDEVEKRHILRVLASFAGNKKSAAQALGISLKTLYNKLHSYGWKAESGRSGSNPSDPA